jgi:hypothetical protein
MSLGRAGLCGVTTLRFAPDNGVFGEHLGFFFLEQIVCLRGCLGYDGQPYTTLG